MKKKYHFNRGKRIYIYTLFLISFFVSCVSRDDRLQQQTEYLDYNTLGLSFVFTYLSRWYIFEIDSGVRISNEIQTLTSPEQENRTPIKAGNFDGILYFTDVEEIKILYEELQERLGVDTSSQQRKENQAGNKQTINFNSWDNLTQIIDKEENEPIRTLFSEALSQNLANNTAIVYTDDVFLLVSPIRDPDKNTIILSATLLYKTNNNYNSIYLVNYNTGIIVSPNYEGNLWQVEEFRTNTESIEFLQHSLRMIKTTKQNR